MVCLRSRPTKLPRAGLDILRWPLDPTFPRVRPSTIAQAARRGYISSIPWMRGGHNEIRTSKRVVRKDFYAALTKPSRKRHSSMTGRPNEQLLREGIRCHSSTARRGGPSRVNWTPEADMQLRMLKLAGKTFREIAAEMPDRTRDSLIARYYTNLRKQDESSPSTSSLPKIKIARVKKWTSEDLATLFRLRTVDKASWDDLVQIFPTRSRNALQLVWKKLTRGEHRSSGRGWTDEENETLVHARVNEGKSWEEVAAELSGRSEHAVKWRYAELDAKTPLVYTSARNMTAEEVERALELRRQGLGWTQISDAMENAYNASSLYHRIRTIENFPDGAPKRKKWTDADDRRLLSLLKEDGGDFARIEEVMGRTLRSCQARLRALRLKSERERSGKVGRRKSSGGRDAEEKEEKAAN